MHHSGFVHLHLHSKYSLLDGAIRPDELVKTVHDYKMPAVAITDHGNLFNAVEFYTAAMKAGVKPILGSEVYIAPGDRRDRTPLKRPSEAAFHLVLLVKNEIGYKNLCTLVTKAFTEGFYYKPRIDKELLREHNEGLIALSACIHGEVAYKVHKNSYEEAKQSALEYREIFDNNRFYLEIQRHEGIADQIPVEKGLRKLSKELGIPLVATNDSHYLKKEEAKVHDALLCIQTGRYLQDEDRMRFTGDNFYVKSAEEMIELFSDVPEAIRNTVEIAERCNFDFDFDTYHLPEFPLPEGETLVEHLETKARDGLEERLMKLSERGIDLESVRLTYHERLEKELKVINRMGFPGYFLIVQDFIDEARRQNVPVGPGRGSAAGSLVAYALGITNLDPIKYNLLFERFLNPDRLSLPDIDIDFCYEGRDKIIKYVCEKYGEENVTQIITFGQMKAKAVIRDVGRVMGMPYGEVDVIAKLVPNVLNITIEEAIEQEPRLKDLIKKDKQVAELMVNAKGLEGLPRHASTHAAGVVISNKPLTNYLPLYMNQKDSTIATQYQMSDVEKIGLVKFDFLGIKTLTVIDRAIKVIRRNRDVGIDIEELPLDDIDTYKLIANGKTNGVFQLESSGMKELLKKLEPSSFEDLIATVALYRPGPLGSGMVDDFIKRKHGKATFTYDLPELEHILENTYGIMVYQEQVMEISKVIAAFTPGDADVLRKAMGKKIPEVMVEQKKKFMEGAKKNKINTAKAERTFDLMAHFAGYGFNKSHSAAYAMISYQTAYLKAHYPVEFMAAQMSIYIGDTDKVMRYIAECRSEGVEVLPPDVNESFSDFTVSGDTIRFGLGAVKNVGSAAIDNIIKVRTESLENDEGEFKSLYDFLCKVDSRKVNKKVVESLIKCGAFDFDENNRLEMLDNVESFMDQASSVQRDREIGQTSLFDTMGTGTDGNGTATAQIRNAIELNEKDILKFEKETLGFYVSSHPLEGYLAESKMYSNAVASTLKDKANNEDVSLLAIVAGKRVTTTKKGTPMAFVNCEDLHGSFEVIVFSKLYLSCDDALDSDEPLLITGRVDKGDGEGNQKQGDGDVPKVIATSIMRVSDASKKIVKKVHIRAMERNIDDTKLDNLKELIANHPGASTVYLHLLRNDDERVVLELPEGLKVSLDSDLIKGVELITGEPIMFTN